jgi:hypothetical protein
MNRSESAMEVVGVQFERSANAYTLHTVIGES